MDYIVALDMKGCICHFTRWQIHPFISMATICWAMWPETFVLLPSSSHDVYRRINVLPDSVRIFVQVTIYRRAFWLVETAVSTDQKPTMYRNLYENMGPAVKSNRSDCLLVIWAVTAVCLCQILCMIRPCWLYFLSIYFIWLLSYCYLNMLLHTTFSNQN